MSKLVRIYPHNPKRGYHARRFKLVGCGYPTFMEKKGWYTVDNATAVSLSRFTNNASGNDPDARPIFQIVSPDQAQAIAKAEEDEIATANDPVSIPREVKRRIAREEAAAKAEGRGEDLGKPVGKVDEEKEAKGPIETASPEDLAEIDALLAGDDDGGWDDDMAPSDGSGRRISKAAMVSAPETKAETAEARESGSPPKSRRVTKKKAKKTAKRAKNSKTGS